MQVVIRNYQSIAAADLQVSGFTAITGRTNLGKSALVRAIQGALFGQTGDAFVRRGCDQAAVGLVFGDGTVLKWYKVQNKAPGRETQLIVNGERHTKLGKEHASLTEKIGTKEIETVAGTLRPQVAMQHDAIFLLAENETVVAEAFKVLGRGDVIAKARDMVKRDWGRTSAEWKMRGDDLSAKEKDTKRYEWVVPARKATELLETKLRAIAAAGTKATKLQRIAAELQATKLTLLPSVPSLKAVNTALPGKIQHLMDLRKADPALPKMPELAEWSPAQAARIQAVLEARNQEQQAVKAMAAGEQALATATQDVLDAEKALGVCPTCGKAFHEAHS